MTIQEYRRRAVRDLVDELMPQVPTAPNVLSKRRVNDDVEQDPEFYRDFSDGLDAIDEEISTLRVNGAFRAAVVSAAPKAPPVLLANLNLGGPSSADVVPKPTYGETRAAFIQRCVADPTLAKIFRDPEQRRAWATATWNMIAWPGTVRPGLLD